MTVSGYIVVILAALAILFVVGIIIGTIAMSWKSCSDERRKSEVGESIVGVVVTAIIIVICIAIYLCVRNF